MVQVAHCLDVDFSTIGRDGQHPSVAHRADRVGELGTAQAPQRRQLQFVEVRTVEQIRPLPVRREGQTTTLTADVGEPTQNLPGRQLDGHQAASLGAGRGKRIGDSRGGAEAAGARFGQSAGQWSAARLQCAEQRRHGGEQHQ